MTRLHFPLVMSLLALVVASESPAGERERRAASTRDVEKSNETKAVRPSRPVRSPRESARLAAAARAAKALASYRAHSLVSLPYRRDFIPSAADQGPANDSTNGSTDGAPAVNTIVYGGSAAPYVMSALSAGQYGGGQGPAGGGSTFPYSYGRLATSYSYGVYGYPYYSYYRPSVAYSVWGWPGISPQGNFGYGGYGLPYGYYGLGNYNQLYFGGFGYPYGVYGRRGYGGAYLW